MNLNKQLVNVRLAETFPVARSWVNSGGLIDAIGIACSCRWGNSRQMDLKWGYAALLIACASARGVNDGDSRLGLKLSGVVHDVCAYVALMMVTPGWD